MKRILVSWGRLDAAAVVIVVVVSWCFGMQGCGGPVVGGLPAPEDGFVFHVRGGRTDVYLAGSFHLLRKSDYPLPRPYETAYDATEKIVFEIPNAAKDTPEIKEAFLAAGVLADDSTLRDYIGEASYAKFAKYLSASGVPVANMMKLRPWFAAVTLAVFEYNRLGARAENGLDQYFEKRATIDGRQIEGLEEVDAQIALFNGLTPAEERQMFDQVLRDIETTRANMKKLIDAWRQGDEELLESFLFQEKVRFEGIYEKLLFSRNRDWIPKIEGFLEGDTPTMVVVGAGHLVGDGSVPYLLRERGFEVEKMSTAAVGTAGTGGGGP